MLEFDEDASRRLVETYRSPDVVAQRRATLELLDPQPGERVIDIGSGPGMLAADIAEAVGPRGSVVGVDVSETMNEIARRTPRPDGGAPMEFVLGDALALPGPDGGFDAAVSTQVYEYVEDMPAALAEARRVLRPGGRLLVLDTDWGSLVWQASDRERAARVIDAWEEHLAHPDLPRRLTGLLEDAGFAVAATSALTLLNAGWSPDTFSAGLIGTVAAYVPGHRGVTEEDAAAWAEELAGLGRDYFFSLTRYLFLATA
jgi:SAM-dependent methyltransferase